MGQASGSPLNWPPMEIVELISPDDCARSELRVRAARSTRARHSHHYIVREGGVDIAFLALDIIPSVDYIVLYEIFVPKEMRARGIGTRLLGEIEDIAKRLGHQKITLTASPVEDAFSE